MLFSPCIMGFCPLEAGASYLCCFSCWAHGPVALHNVLELLWVSNCSFHHKICFPYVPSLSLYVHLSLPGEMPAIVSQGLFLSIAFHSKKIQRRVLKKNPLKNLRIMVKLNPYAKTARRRAILLQEKNVSMVV